MHDSIFTKIIKGQIPCHKIYEDGLTFAFLDINPIQPGHTLVIPKKQIGFIWDLEPVDYQALMATVQKVGQHLREIFPDQARIGVIVEGLEVIDHAHIKLVPFSSQSELHAKPALGEPDHAALAKIAQKLAF